MTRARSTSMANLSSVFNLCGLFKKQISFNDENENDFRKSNDGISLKSQRSPKSFGKAGISPTSEAPSETSGDQASSNVSDIEQDEIAEGSSSKVAEGCLLPQTSIDGRPREESTRNVEIKREENDFASSSERPSRPSGLEAGERSLPSSDTEPIRAVSSDEVTSMNRKFQLQYTKRYYIRRATDSSYLWVRRRQEQLTVRTRVRRTIKPRAIFKVHFLQEMFHSNDSAMAVALQHERSGFWISLKKSGVTLERGGNLDHITPDDPRLLKMVQEGPAMTYMFKSYQLSEAGYGVFLGSNKGSKSVVPVPANEQHPRPENAVFRLFTAP